jgi:hypothetical protein
MFSSAHARRPNARWSRTEAALAEALFASSLQRADAAFPEDVRRAVDRTLRQLGRAGCSQNVAGEFGEHPETAPARMAWALATIRLVYSRGADRRRAHVRQHCPQLP